MSKFNVVQTAAMLTILTLVSKLLGFFRETIMANYYGTSYVADAYVMALSVPNILFAGIFAAVSTAYMPIFSTVVQDQGEEAGNKYTSAMLNLLLVASFAIAAIGILFSDQIVVILASGFRGEVASLTSYFIKVILCMCFFSSTLGIMTSYLEYKGKFLLQVVGSYAQNIIIIITIIVSFYMTKNILIIGPLLGVFTLWIFCFIIIKKNGFTYYPTLHSGGNTRRMLRLAVPVFIGSAVEQISLFVDRTFATWLPESNVSALNYAQILIGMVATISNVLFIKMIYPKLTQASAARDYKKMGEYTNAGINIITLISVPCTLGGLVYSNQIIQIIYERGAFGLLSTQLTSTAFFYYMIGLWFSGISSLLVYVFYALHDTKTPVKIGIISVGADIIFNIILFKPMGIAGLALSTSIGQVISTILLYYTICHKHTNVNILKSKIKIIKIITASALSILISWVTYNYIVIPNKDILYPRILQFGITAIMAIIIYYIILRIMKIEELKLLFSLFKLTKTEFL